MLLSCNHGVLFLCFFRTEAKGCQRFLNGFKRGLSAYLCSSGGKVYVNRCYTGDGEKGLGGVSTAVGAVHAFDNDFLYVASVIGLMGMCMFFAVAM